jgi:sugar phosphate isomerase/epimerase
MRPLTLFTGQWADLELAELAQMAADWGFDGLEIASWGRHLDIRHAAEDPAYVPALKALLDDHGLTVHAVSGHLVGHVVCDDPIDQRHHAIVADHVWGDGDPAGVRARAAHEMVRLGEVAARLGATVVTGFTGSPIWKYMSMFPPVEQKDIDHGYALVADTWRPILRSYADHGIRFALEVHPTQIAYDYWSASRVLEELGEEENFGFNFDPSHFTWQGMDPSLFVDDFADRIFHVHCKDSKRNIANGRNGILSSHLRWGDPRRGWDVVSLGKGDTDWDKCMRSLNRAGYEGPLSIEWEDAGMDRVIGIRESLQFLRSAQFEPAEAAFDAALSS